MRRAACAAVGLLGAVLASGCDGGGGGERTSTVPSPATQQQVAEPELSDERAARAARAIDNFGCTSCHMVPGVVGRETHVGPPLDGIARRAYIAGVLENTPDNMVSWIRDPQAAAPLTAMPDLGVGERDARDITAYLYERTGTP